MNKRSGIILAAIVLACVLAVVVALTFVFSDKEESTSPAGPTSLGSGEDAKSLSQEERNHLAETATDKDEFLKAFGPWSDDGLHFPRPYFDDSSYVRGQYSVTLDSTPLWVPRDPDGDILSNKTGEDSCQKQHEITGKVQAQYVHGRYMVFSENYGPTESNDTVSTGYTHGPVGAVLTASNAFSIGSSGADAPALETIKLYAPKLKELSERLKAKERMAGPTNFGFLPIGYKLKTCSPELVSGYIAINAGDGGDNPYSALPFNAVWKENKWELVSSPAGDNQNIILDSLDGYTEIQYE